MTANCSFGARAFFLRAKSHYRVMVGLINSTRHRNGVNTRDAGSRNKCPLTAEDKNQGREGFLRCSFWNFSDHQPLSQGHFSVVLLFHLTWFLNLWSQTTDALLCSYTVVDIILKIPLKIAILSLHDINIQALLKMERSNGELANSTNKLLNK